MENNPYFTKNWQERIEFECKLNNHSHKTLKQYLYYISKFLKENVSLTDFLILMASRGFSPATIKVAAFAIRFYFKSLGFDEPIEKRKVLK